MATRDEIRKNAYKLESAGASPEKIREYVSLASQSEVAPENSAPQFGGNKAAQSVLGDPGLSLKDRAKSAWEGLAAPEQKSREGLNAIASKMPSPDITGNTLIDVAGATPRIAAETLAEVAPSFISRGSMVGSAALKGAQLAAPAANVAGRYVAGQAERLSGLAHKTPGVLAEVAEDPSILIGPGKSAAREIYAGVKDESKIRETLKFPQKALEFVKRSWIASKKGSLSPDEALEARKALDDIGDTLPDIVRKSLRKTFDTVAKQKFGKADAAFAKAVKSEAVRNLLPLNQSGSASQLRSLIMGGGLGMAQSSPAALAVVPAFSPLAQGTIAAGVGLGAKAAAPFVQNPQIATLLSALQSLSRD